MAATRSTEPGADSSCSAPLSLDGGRAFSFEEHKELVQLQCQQERARGELELEKIRQEAHIACAVTRVMSRGKRGYPRNFENFNPRGKREYERQSGTGISPEEKRGGRRGASTGSPENVAPKCEKVAVLAPNPDDPEDFPALRM
ncbi:hypothetical protein CRUP_013967 [Coryphaenoides rupestris]|nr:hypothetical protein CRUP_013967 [Coryphaenoides rupestris]